MLAVGACSSDEVDLLVDLKTDYVPGVEFAFVRGYLVRGDAEIATPPVVATYGTDFTSGRRIAEFPGLTPGSHQVRVVLRDLADEVVAERRLVAQVRAGGAVTVVIGRACGDVECPGTLDPASATECANGACVPPECGEAMPEACARRCLADTDCATEVSCARAVCAHGECLAIATDACGAAAYCHPDLGCLELPGGDAGTRDAGGDDAGGDDAGADAGADACVPASEVCNGLDENCNALVDEGACGVNEVCLGAAGCECEPGWFDCDASAGCETMEGPSACGRCDQTCEGGTPVCDTTADACVSGCGALARCGASCVDTATSPAHCGGCDQPCSSSNGTPFCMAGGCRIMCDPGFDDCDDDVGNGCEQALTTLAHCGGCNVPCSITHTVVSCATGSCAMTGCEPLYDDCDGVASNGCEQYLDHRDHCGACGAGCTTNEGCAEPGLCHCGFIGSGPSGTGASVCGDLLDHVAVGRCTGSVPARCGIVSCDSGWADCDGMAYTGCETALRTNMNCASCGDACISPQTCVSGSCR